MYSGKLTTHGAPHQTASYIQQNLHNIFIPQSKVNCNVYQMHSWIKCTYTEEAETKRIWRKTHSRKKLSAKPNGLQYETILTESVPLTPYTEFTNNLELIKQCHISHIPTVYVYTTLLRQTFRPTMKFYIIGCNFFH